MSEENVEIVRRGTEAFEDDEEAWLQTLDPDLVWYPIEDGHIPSRGIDGAKGVRQRWLDTWEGHSIAVEDLTGADENVVATIHVSGRGKGSGVRVAERTAHIWTLRDGKLFHNEHYREPEQALRELGL